MKVNGEERSIQDLKSPDLKSLLELFSLKADGIAVEINGKVVQRKDWPSVTLNTDDQVELIRFVGGG